MSPIFSSLDFEDLLEKAKNGCLSSLATILEAYRTQTAALVRQQMPRPLQSKEGGSDIFAEVCMKAIQSISGFHGGTPEEFSRWIATCVSNVIQDCMASFHTQRRDISREVSLQSLSPSTTHLLTSQERDPLEQLLQDEEKTILQAVIEALPEQTQTIMQLRKSGKTFQQIGEELGLEESTARKTYTRALRDLRKNIAFSYLQEQARSSQQDDGSRNGDPEHS